MQPARSASGNVSRRIQRQNSANSFDHNARMLPDERGLEEDVYGERRDESDMQLPAGAFRTVEHHTEKVEGGSTSTKESGKEPLLPPSGEVPVETKKQKVRGVCCGWEGGRGADLSPGEEEEAVTLV